MDSENIKILSHNVVHQKLLRMAYEIWENHAASKEVYICGVEGSGTAIAKIIYDILVSKSDISIHYLDINVVKESPLGQVTLSADIPRNAEIIIVDDVANTGNVLFHTLTTLAHLLPKKIEIAVLVNRMHKSYPILPNYIGHNISTTLQDHILVKQDENGAFSVYLK